MSTTLDTRKVVVIAGNHLTEETSRLLERTPLKDWPVSGGIYPFGFFVYAHEEGVEIEDLAAVCLWAHEQGFDYVMIDCDGDPVDGLPTYEWSEP